jgi:hypothetical protein
MIKKNILNYDVINESKNGNFGFDMDELYKKA